ncbi:MAG: hypothetical protein HZC40_19440 [Chloroflexi bacterium]|nr:hypothetical protein [Chloroflexota bacterium]
METRRIGIAMVVWVAVFTPLFVITSLLFIRGPDSWNVACFGTVGSVVIATLMSGLSLMQVLKFPGKPGRFGIVGCIASLPLWFLWAPVFSWRIFEDYRNVIEVLYAVLFPIVGQIPATIAQLTCMFWPLSLGPIIYLWARRRAKKNDKDLG